ncbi:hypothetical protein PUNSTDRAFT_103724 [Punctularia strigosozonata HHB-11173 SS5]|uniref:uncharacterized protein n=1 Tax=Punctularia strigosozonata (strain HHB-11173) TaxID=741275 RepID=UPI0004416A44|nr:uncharacterized protein PUNSTDRAFT_103724 [Punctularia strigosozonata HHB-11173 SS5]EIN07664.1 hypothetical protein PUNSTDRAFT_103724 [Punctularia strigosozonata HHB-11173 SS5]
MIPAVHSCRRRAAGELNVSAHIPTRTHRPAAASCLSRSFATVVENTQAVHSRPSANPPDDATRKRNPRPLINAAVIVNRSPIITRSPTTFERAYYAYQQRIQRALHNPFPSEFYFKQGSPLEAKFNMEEREREERAFGKGYGKHRAGEESDAAKEASAVEMTKEFEEEVQEAGRKNRADYKKDTKSLDRAGQRNLYLLLLKKEQERHNWVFPQRRIEKGELLHQASTLYAAERGLYQECGSKMDSWIVSRNPIGVYEPASSPSESASKEYTFFYKAHIFAGQAVTDSTSISDFAWLTKEEIADRVQKEYWDGVKDMLSDF